MANLLFKPVRESAFDKSLAVPRVEIRDEIEPTVRTTTNYTPPKALTGGSFQIVLSPCDEAKDDHDQQLDEDENRYNFYERSMLVDDDDELECGPVPKRCRKERARQNLGASFVTEHSIIGAGVIGSASGGDARNQEFVIFSPFHKRLGGIEDENFSADGEKENDKSRLNTMQSESNKVKFSRSFAPDALNLKSASVLSPVKSKTVSKRKQRSLRKTIKN